MSAIKISSTSSLLNLHVIKPFEFIGKKAVTPVTIFLKLAGSILTCLVESSRKFFFVCALDFLLFYLYHHSLFNCVFSSAANF